MEIALSIFPIRKNIYSHFVRCKDSKILGILLTVERQVCWQVLDLASGNRKSVQKIGTNIFDKNLFYQGEFLSVKLKDFCNKKTIKIKYITLYISKEKVIAKRE